jgi:hypothetical protein
MTQEQAQKLHDLFNHQVLDFRMFLRTEEGLEDITDIIETNKGIIVCTYPLEESLINFEVDDIQVYERILSDKWLTI